MTKTTLRRILLVLLLLVFVVTTGWIAAVRLRYRASREKYADAAAQYAEPAGRTPLPQNGVPVGENPEIVDVEENTSEDQPPISINFEKLQEKSPAVVAWIYCEDSLINYPVVQAPDNDYYLERDYTGNYDPSGAIFTDEADNPGFVDSNTIIYGHHMADMSMFASLEYWLKEDYFRSHPVMWLLTPEQNYRVELFSVYPTIATSETYTIYYQPRQEFDGYLRQVKAWSLYQTEVELESDAHYVVLSTCAYNYDEGRTVLHGKLVPVPAK